MPESRTFLSVDGENREPHVEWIWNASSIQNGKVNTLLSVSSRMVHQERFCSRRMVRHSEHFVSTGLYRWVPFNPKTLNLNSQFRIEHVFLPILIQERYLCFVRNSPESKDFFLVLFVRIKRGAPVFWVWPLYTASCVCVCAVSERNERVNWAEWMAAMLGLNWAISLTSLSQCASDCGSSIYSICWCVENNCSRSGKTGGSHFVRICFIPIPAIFQVSPYWSPISAMLFCLLFGLSGLLCLEGTRAKCIAFFPVTNTGKLVICGNDTFTLNQHELLCSMRLIQQAWVACQKIVTRQNSSKQGHHIQWCLSPGGRFTVLRFKSPHEFHIPERKQENSAGGLIIPTVWHWIPKTSFPGNVGSDVVLSVCSCGGGDNEEKIRYWKRKSEGSCAGMDECSLPTRQENWSQKLDEGINEARINVKVGR